MSKIRHILDFTSLLAQIAILKDAIEKNAKPIVGWRILRRRSIGFLMEELQHMGNPREVRRLSKELFNIPFATPIEKFAKLLEALRQPKSEETPTSELPPTPHNAMPPPANSDASTFVAPSAPAMPMSSRHRSFAALSPEEVRAEAEALRGDYAAADKEIAPFVVSRRLDVPTKRVVAIESLPRVGKLPPEANPLPPADKPKRKRVVKKLADDETIKADKIAALPRPPRAPRKPKADANANDSVDAPKPKRAKMQAAGDTVRKPRTPRVRKERDGDDASTSA